MYSVKIIKRLFCQLQPLLHISPLKVIYTEDLFCALVAFLRRWAWIKKDISMKKDTNKWKQTSQRALNRKWETVNKKWCKLVRGVNAKGRKQTGGKHAFLYLCYANKILNSSLGTTENFVATGLRNYSRTRYIWIKWNGEPSGYAENLDNWIFL